MASKVDRVEWSNTKHALDRLVNLLDCPICGCRMEDPCSLNSCNHNFCRNCIERALSENQTNCPICHIPAWIKDVKSDRQVATLIKCVTALNDFTKTVPIHGGGDTCSSFTTIPHDKKLFCASVTSGRHIQRRLKSRKRISFPFLVNEHLTHSLPQQPINHLESNQVTADHGNSINKADLKKEANTADLFGETVKSSGFSTSTKKSQCFSHFQSSSTRRQSLDTEAIAQGGTQVGSNTRWCQSSKMTKFTAETANHLKQGVSACPGSERCPTKRTTDGHTSKRCATSRSLQRNFRGETPLHLAAIKGNLDVVRDLLQQGVNPNVRDNAGWTPLHECCNHGHLEIASLLLDHGALINAPGFNNDTPLHDAVANGHTNIASLLIARGANPQLRNRHGVVARDIALGDAMRNTLSHPQPSFSPNLLISPNAIVSPSNLPIHSQNGSEVILLGTGLKAPQKVQLEETAKQLGAKVVDSFSPQVTHLVTTTNESKCCPRTLKFLCAVAHGKWIVSFPWVERCHQEGQWVEEMPYEVMGIEIHGNSLITEAPRKGREAAILQIPRLFDGCEFYFCGNFLPPHPSKGDLVRLVKMAGGAVLSREPRSSPRTVCPYHAKPGFTSHFIVISGSSTYQIKADSGAFHVPPTWIFDCLSHFELINTLID